MTKHLNQTAALAVFVLSLATPAFAQSSVDPGTSLANLLTWGLVLAGVVIAIMCIFKGIHAVAEGRHIGPILVGLVVGTAICFGGATLVQKMVG